MIELFVPRDIMEEGTVGQANSERSGQSKYDVVLLLLLSLSLSGNVAIGAAFLRLANSPTTSTASGPNVPAGPATGTRLPLLQAKDLSGKPVSIAFDSDSRPTVLYVFTPTCIWCKKNLQNLKSIVAKNQDRFKFIGLSLSPDGVDAYLKDTGLDFPVYTGPAPEIVRSFGLGATPSTFVLSTTGVLQRHWTGAYAGATIPEVEDFFGVKLPGLVGS